MAKRKTPKVDKVVDLKPKAEKITDEQLQKLQKSVGNINRAKTELGALELQKHSIVKIIEELAEKVQENEEKQAQINQALDTLKRLL